MDRVLGKRQQAAEARMKIVFARDALDDLDQIDTFIAQDKPAVARQQIGRLKEAVLTLADHPMIGPPDEISGMRKLVRTPYIIHYRVERNRVVILRIRHGRQHPL